MRHHSLVTTPKKNSTKTEKRHVFSELLKTDSRVQSAPRVVENVHSLAGPNGHTVFLVKIYSGLETPGTELMTVSCVSPVSGVEVEIRFDERFPVAIRFRDQTDAERVVYARELIGRAGGFEALLGMFRSAFPKISV